MADVCCTVRLLIAIIGGIFILQLAVSDGVEIVRNVTWDAAFHACQDHGGKLYNTTDHSGLHDVTSGSYWIGAKVQFTSWIWTESNEPLFTYIGQWNGSLPENQTHEIPQDNQASRCFFTCKLDSNPFVYVGLQGSKCLCIEKSDLNLSEEDNTMKNDRCLGNVMEYCGSTEGISIYSASVLVKDSLQNWQLDSSGQCGYIFKAGPPLHIVLVEAEVNCSQAKGFICSCPDSYTNDSCYYHTKNHSWSSANSTCQLVTLTANNIESIRNKIQNQTDYWIGLKRSKYIGWIDRDENINVEINTGDNGCVSLEKQSNGTVSFTISNCGDIKSALCITYLSFATTKNPQDGKQKGQSSAIVVGASVGIVVAVAVIGTFAAIIWMKRSKRLCFKDKSMPSVNASRDTLGSKITDFELANDPSDISQSNYEQICKGNSNYKFETVPNANMTNGPEPNQIALATNPNDVARPTSEGDYNILHVPSPSCNSLKTNTNIYSHIHMKKNNPYHGNHYDVTGPSEHPARNEGYNHIDDLTNDDYDTAGPKFISVQDPTYSHMNSVDEGGYGSKVHDLISDADVDGDYNHL